MKLLVVLWLPFIRTARYGARTSIYLATSPEVEGKTGGFWGKCREKRIKPKWIDEAGEQAIWKYCEQACAEWL